MSSIFLHFHSFSISNCQPNYGSGNLGTPLYIIMDPQDDTSGTTGRGPKYRTSCDNCQAAKIKCGQQKPSCRRCAVNKLRCIYGVSRRMGRPRAKKNAAEDYTREQSGVGSDDSAASRPETRGAGFLDSEMEVAGASRHLTSELNQTPDPWSPTLADFEPTNGSDALDHSHVQTAAKSLDLLPADTAMELDEASHFLMMPPFLDELSGPADSRHPISLSSPDLLKTRDLFPAQFSPVGGQNGHQTESTPNANIAAPSNPRFDDIFDFLPCRSLSDASTCQRGGTLAYPHMAPTPKPLSSTTRLDSEEGPRRSDTRRMAADQKKTRSVSIDDALLMESKIEVSLSQLHRCKNCCHDGAVHLLALVGVRTILDILQEAARDEFVTRPKQWTGPDPVDGGILWVGSFKVGSRARLRFLRILLEARFYRLAVLIEEREKLVDCISEDSLGRASSQLLADISGDLRTVMGWLELWNANCV